MVLRRFALVIYLSLLLLITGGTASNNVLINGTNIYLATGESYGLYQGYVLSLKSVSSDGSMWLQLTDDDTIVKNEIISYDGIFIYNKTNIILLYVKPDRVYSSPSEQSLVSFYVFQFLDREKPQPDRTINPENTRTPGNNSSSSRIDFPQEPIIWTLGIALVLILFYILRKFW
ncbi:MAG TPA: S-layer protein domain-containing protein [Candidatus Methanoperedens sp.]|nr:S-layer protein domain-containing protein [Candidatus Methanoperedens sp.]HLB70085.1 S-layer protein domain-containing protein [Candidatus Methanoperedens sp.]